MVQIGVFVRRLSEDEQHSLGKYEVQHPDICAHDQDKNEHDPGVAQQLLASRPNDLAQFCNDLPEEERHPLEDTLVCAISLLLLLQFLLRELVGLVFGLLSFTFSLALGTGNRSR